jgi:hypothetical protein
VGRLSRAGTDGPGGPARLAARLLSEVPGARPRRPRARGRPGPVRAGPEPPGRTDGRAPVLLGGRPRMRHRGQHRQALRPVFRALVPGGPPPPPSPHRHRAAREEPEVLLDRP